MNSYRELALYDLKSVKANYEFELWNKVGKECQQVCEKYLKHFLYINHLLAADLERTHNLKKLLKAIPNYDKSLYKELSVIGDYYFEASYPGDNFITLDKEMADEAIHITESLINYIESIYIKI